jgi:predicted transcriptional regulator of viral defense system
MRAHFNSICYNMCMARTEDRLRELALDHAGYLTSMEAADAGIPHALLVQMANRARLERVGQGIYRFPSWGDTAVQQYHEALLWPQAKRHLPYAVISHDSALELYGLTDLNPGNVHVTVPPKTRIVRTLPAWLQIHKEMLSPDERTIEATVPVVTVARAIAEVAPTRGLDVVHRAVRDARARNLLREDELAQLVRQFGSFILDPYHAE